MIPFLLSGLRLVATLGIILTICPAGRVSAQTGGDTGTITGRVTNQATGDNLVNAVVTVSGTNVTAVCQRDGTYVLSLPPGTYDVQFHYTGLDTAKFTVAVAANQTTTQDAAMTAEVYKLSKFVVKGVREGNAAALMEQRYSPNPKLVAANDAWGMPAANPGELVQRLASISVDTEGPEVRTIYLRGLNADFISVQIDGNSIASSAGSSASRRIQMEQMGMGNVESIEVVKGNTPDRDANAVAGYVNLVTRRGFDTSERRLELTTGFIGRFRDSPDNPFHDRLFNNLDIINLNYADALSVLGKKRNLGIAVNVSSRRSATVQDEAGNNLTFTSGVNVARGADQPIVCTYGAGPYWYPTQQLNAGLGLDLKLDDAGSYAFLRTTYNHSLYYQQYNLWGVWMPNNIVNFTSDTTPDYVKTVTTGVSGSYASTTSGQSPKKGMNYTINPGFSLKLFDKTGQLDVNYSHSYALVWYPGNEQFQSRVSGVGFNIDYRDQDRLNPVLTQTYGADWSNADNYTPASRSHNTYSSPDELSAMKVDFKKTLPFRHPTFLKVGAKYQVDNRAQDINGQSYSLWSGGAGIRNWMSGYYKLNWGKYGPVPFIGIPNTGAKDDIVGSGFSSSSNQDLYNAIVTSTQSDASMKERIMAAYALGQSKIGKLTILAGLRFERTFITGTGWINNSSSSLAYSSSATLDQNLTNARARFGARSTVRSQYSEGHPNLNLNYELMPGLLLRASIGKSITRPAVANMLPITTVNPTNSTLSQGNPALRPYMSKNIDLAIEKYFEPVGQFSISYFHKHINDYIASYLMGQIADSPDNGFGGQYAGYSLSSYKNIGSAYIQGWEFNYQQQFNFLPGLLRGLGIQANETILKSEGSFGTAYGANGQTGPLTGLSSHQTNAGFFYTLNGWDFRLMANVRGRNPYSYSYTSATSTIYRPKWTRVDFKAQYTFGRRYTAFLSVDNITNEPNYTYEICGKAMYTDWQGVGVVAGLTTRF